MALEKATIETENTGDAFTVMFNPEEYTINKNINYAQASVPGLSSPLLQFVHGQHADPRDGAARRYLRGARDG